MKKIRLELDMLSVETFSTTGGAAEARGTVNAHGPDSTQDWDCHSINADCGTAATDECGTCNTEWETCYAYSCGATMCDTCVTCGGPTCQGEDSCSCFPCQY